MIDITFTWTDSFTSRKCSVPSIIYEKAAVLFNIAALYTKIAYNASNVLSVPYLMGRLRIQQKSAVVQAIDALRNAALYFSQLANEYSTRPAADEGHWGFVQPGSEDGDASPLR